MPLSKLQIDILRLLASHRDPESFVGGSTPLNRSTLRYSGDIDIFHDREERVREAAELDSSLLKEHGYALRWHRRDPMSKYPPAEPEALRLLAPQRGLFATV